MRARYAIVIIAIAILAIGAKLFVFPPKDAAAIYSPAGLDIQQMHKDKKNIPVREMSDMSLVFDRNN